MLNYLSILSITIGLSVTAAYAQNLVPNPDFEQRDSDFCGIAGTSDLATSLAAWYSATSGTPDVYFTDIASSCWNFQPNSTYPGPIGIKGSQLPRSGSSMSGIGVYTIAGMNQREYIQIELSSPLIPTGKYLVEYYVSLADYTEFASNNLGVHLSTTAVSNGTNGVLSVNPQFTSTNVIGDTQGWVRVVDTIVANDAHSFLTIGNFENDASTVVEANPTASFEPGMYGAYYFIDDVRVERVIQDPTAGAGQMEIGCVKVFPNPTSGEVWVELSQEDNEVEIELIDLNGKLMWSVKNGLKKQMINMEGLKDGLYFVRVKSLKGSFVERIVKK
jgi:hypothetical protein